MSETSISVAMATYNGERFLQDQLDSFARQTLLPYELVACDDGSTDGTLDILHMFAAKAPFPVRIYQNETRLGHGLNFIRAMSYCSGNLIAFSDQDDVWLERKLERCSAAIAETGSNLVIHSAEAVDEELRPLGRVTSPIRRPVLLDAGAGRGWRPICWRQVPLIPGFACVFRSWLIGQVPPAPPLTGPGIGHEAWLEFASEMAGTITFLPDVLSLYRQHDRNTIGYLDPIRGKADPVKAGEEEFGLWAKSAASYSSILAGAAARSPEIRPRLNRACQYYDTRAKALARRAALYSAGASFLAVARRLVSMVLDGTYRAKSAGGLGVRGLAKDLFMLLFRRIIQSLLVKREKIRYARPMELTSSRSAPSEDQLR